MFLGNPDRKGGAGAFIDRISVTGMPRSASGCRELISGKTLSQVMGEEEYMTGSVMPPQG